MVLVVCREYLSEVGSAGRRALLRVWCLGDAGLQNVL